jgi:heme/copper-type cytochrome/quinol oxidase subunit 4
VPRLIDLGKFVLFAGLTILAAWIAATGRVAYMFTMLVIAAALAFAVLDLVDYEIRKRRRG